jgi:DNA-binding NtrC family response regulator
MTVLAIDPNRNNLEIIEKQTQKDRHNFIGITETDQGLEYLTTQDVDVVIANKFLPNRDGFEILRTALAKIPPSPVVVVSHQNTVDAMIEALKLGAIDYISDPIDPKVLKIAIHRAYERRQMHLIEQLESKPKQDMAFGFLQGASPASRF